MAARLVGCVLAMAIGGCGLVYRYDDYRDAPTSAGGRGGAGGAGGCVPPADDPGDCRKPSCAGGVPGTVADDADLPPVVECRTPSCSHGVPTYDDVTDGVACATGVCASGACVECIGREQCGGRCCEIGNACSPSPPACPNGCLDGDETDVDCGGSCTFKCANAARCLVGSDCQSGFCAPSGHCRACLVGGTDCGPLCCQAGVCGVCP